MRHTKKGGERKENAAANWTGTRREKKTATVTIIVTNQREGGRRGIERVAVVSTFTSRCVTGTETKGKKKKGSPHKIPTAPKKQEPIRQPTK